MSQVIAFTYNADQKSTELATRCLALLNKEYKLLNIPQFRVEKNVKSGIVVVTFGRPAGTAVRQYVEEENVQNVHHISLPGLSKLQPSQSNIATRKKALEKINNLREYLSHLPSNSILITIEEKDLPDLNYRHLAMLEKIIETSEEDSFFQVAKNGKTIEISKEKKKDSKADISITFAEIYTLRLIMDVLKTDEVIIVHSA